MVGPTGTQGCTQPGHCVGQTGWHTCGCPLGPTGTEGWPPQAAMAQISTLLVQTVCTQLGCGVVGQANPTASTRCFICPPLEAAAMVGPTGTQGCTQPGHCVGQTGWHLRLGRGSLDPHRLRDPRIPVHADQQSAMSGLQACPADYGMPARPGPRAAPSPGTASARPAGTLRLPGDHPGHGQRLPAAPEHGGDPVHALSLPDRPDRVAHLRLSVADRGAVDVLTARALPAMPARPGAQLKGSQDGNKE